MPNPRAAVPTLALAMSCFPAFGAAHWLKLTSANFELYTSAGEKKGREAILEFEQVRGFFLKALHPSQTSALAVRIVAFSSAKEYLPYRFNEFAAAFYATDGQRDYIVMQNLGPESYPVAVHEFTHLLIKHMGGAFPPWLNEGFADFYSSLRPAGKKVEIGHILPERLSVLRDSKWIDLPTLVEIGHDSPYYNERARAGIFYAESWALVHMLVMAPDYRPCVAPVSALLAAGKPAPEAFQAACGKSLAAVQKDLERYARGSEFYSALADIQLEKGAEKPDVDPATPLESGLVLAQVLALSHHESAARARLDALAREYPRSWEVEAAIARLDWHARRDEDARRRFARAAELGSTDPQMYLDYATLAGGKSAILRKAVELKPDWQEAQYRFGLALAREGSYQEALDHLRLVKNVTPQQAFRYFHGLAYATYHLGRKEEALQYAEEARKWAKLHSDVVLAEQLIAYLKGSIPNP